MAGRTADPQEQAPRSRRARRPTAPSARIASRPATPAPATSTRNRPPAEINRSVSKPAASITSPPSPQHSQTTMLEGGRRQHIGEHLQTSRVRVGASGCSLPSGESVGSQSSQCGRYQFRSPRSFIVAGRSTPRMIVASIRTAIASPMPSCLIVDRPQRREDREHGDHDDRGAGYRPGGGRIPWETASSVFIPRSTQLLDPAEDEHVVVHRQSEQNDEEEQRQP